MIRWQHIAAALRPPTRASQGRRIGAMAMTAAVACYLASALGIAAAFAPPGSGLNRALTFGAGGTAVVAASLVLVVAATIWEHWEPRTPSA